MTGKADAVRAVGQQYKALTNAIVDRIMAHLSDHNAEEILGPGLSPLIGRGPLKSIVAFSLCADVLRVVQDIVMADGEISDEEIQECLGLLSVLADGFAKVRSKDYASASALTVRDARGFLSRYTADQGLFGFTNESTKWAGVKLCLNVQSYCGDATPLETFGAALLDWATVIAASDTCAESEHRAIESLRSVLKQQVSVARTSGTEDGGKSDVTAVADRPSESLVVSTNIEEDHRRLEEILRRSQSRGTWIEDNASRGINAWRAAAERGDPHGQLIYGLCLYFGSGVPEDHAAAFELFGKASASGDVQASFGLAQCYIGGFGTEENVSEALRWFRTAADRGLTPALTQLGLMYREGLGVEEDPLFAYDCWRLAADQGDPEGQRLVGLAYAEGYGVEQDENRAREWLLDAAEAGDEEAKKLLEQLSGDDGTESESGDADGDPAHVEAIEDGVQDADADDADADDDEDKDDEDKDDEDEGAEAEQSEEQYPDDILTADIAREALEDDSRDLDQFSSIDDDAAAVLSDYRGYCLRLDGLVDLSAKSARSLAAYKNGDLQLNGLRSISDEVAAGLGEHRGGLELNGLTSLSISAAGSLAKIRESTGHRARLSLNGLLSLTDGAADHFVGFGGMLSLDGLQTLSTRAATALGKGCEYLSLDGLVHIDTAAAAALASIEDLSLDSVRHLDAPTAAALAGVEQLSLDGLEELSDAAAEAFAVGAPEDAVLSLEGVVRLSDSAAAALGRRAGTTYVRGLREISPGVLKALFTSNTSSYGPQLDKLEHLPNEVAAMLADYNGDVHLNGVTEMSDIAAEYLSRHQGSLYLQGLTTLSAAAADSLSRHSGLMRTDCANERKLELTGAIETTVWRCRKKRIPSKVGMPYEQRRVLMRDVALKFAADPKSVDLARFTHITRGAAIALGGETGGWGAQMAAWIDDESPLRFRKMGASMSDNDACEHDLNLSGLVELDVECAAAIAGNEGRVLDLSGLTELSSDLIGALGQVDFGYRGEIRLNGLKSLDSVAAGETYGVFGTLTLNGLEQLTEEIASNLAGHSRNGDNGLALDGLRILSEEAAGVLASHGGWLSLNGLTTIKSQIADALAEHSAGLSLNGIRSLDKQLAAAIAEHRGALELGGLSSIDEGVARALSKHRNLLSLPGVVSLDTNTAVALARHDGELNLSGLQRITEDGAQALHLHPSVALPDHVETTGKTTETPAALATYPDVVRSLRSADTPQGLQLVLTAIASLNDERLWDSLRAGLAISQDGAVTIDPDAPLRFLVAAAHRVPVAVHVLTRGRTSEVSRLRVSLGFLRPLSRVDWSVARDTCSLESLEWLAAFPHLESLVVAGVTKDVDMSAIESLSKLRTLKITDCASLPDLDALVKLPALETLDLSGNEWLKDEAVGILAVLNNVRTIDLSGCGLIRDTSALEKLEGVEVLSNSTETGSDEEPDDDPPPAPSGPFTDPPGTTTNSIGMKLVPIPAGEFLMGSSEDCPLGDPDEEFQHRVRITKPFMLGMHQVTQAQYQEVTGENPSFFEGPDLPVEHLSWKQAQRFCELLSSRPAEVQAGRRYRLPTEAEWEYACRAGTITPFNTGDSLESDEARFASVSRSSPKQTAPVGTYPPNAWGLFDMHGNVWEWTSDWFSADYFRESHVDDPQGPATGTHHTLRGGSASVESHECRSTIRGEADPADGPDADGAGYAFLGDFGLRVVCVATSAQPHDTVHSALRLHAHGKAEAVRAISQQFRTRLSEVVDGVTKHVNDNNAKEILGPGLSQLMSRGAIKSIVTFALYADVLRMVRDMVMTDGEISDDEVQAGLGLMSLVASGFAKVRKDYALHATLSAETTRAFLSQYEADAGLFGHANESTKWAGVSICRSIQSRCDDSRPLDVFGGALVAWAEETALNSLRNYVGHEPAFRGTT
jgi:formylglycine-generating enzyme required for sulfatase activity/TPR repeat protein